MSNDNTEDRAVGCLLGLAVGDALGSTLEFTVRDTQPRVTEMVGGGPFRLKPGQWTDDTAMALCLADALLRGGATLSYELLMDNFLKWRDGGEFSCTGACFDVGSTVDYALTRYRIGEKKLVRRKTNSSNGSIMRLAPAVIVTSDYSMAARFAKDQSQATHSSELVTDCVLALAGELHRLVWGERSDGSYIAKHSAVRNIQNEAYALKTRDHIKSTGYAVDTLEAAKWCMSRHDSFEGAVEEAANLGGDSDTVSAVTGQLAGARWGASSIPKRWVEKLAWRDYIVEIAKALHAWELES